MQIRTLLSKYKFDLRLVGKNLDLGKLEEALGGDMLFTMQKTVLIEGLFSLPKSKKKDALIDSVKSHADANINLVLAETKVLTATQLKSFPKATVKLCKYPALLFTFLENLGVANKAKILELFHQVLEREDAEMIFVMLVRQVRILLAFVADGTYEGAPFMRAKIASQAKNFDLQKLLALHTQLLKLDEAQKTSSSTLTLTQNLDLMLVEV